VSCPSQDKVQKGARNIFCFKQKKKKQTKPIFAGRGREGHTITPVGKKKTAWRKRKKSLSLLPRGGGKKKKREEGLREHKGGEKKGRFLSYDLPGENEFGRQETFVFYDD